MNKSESKYFHTAARMDEAFLTLLEQKDFAFITVKEICEKAGVNRSTFYLHYETLSDLLAESLTYMNRQFLAYFQPGADSFLKRIRDCPLEELYLLTPEYLTPYLRYIRENRRLFRVALEKPERLGLDEAYGWMLRHVITPILERYQVPERDRGYRMAFYIRGVMGIITQWLEGDCADSIDFVISVIEQCVMRP